MWRENILTVTASEDVLVVFGEIVLDNELRMRWNRIRKLLRHFVDHEFEPQLFSLLGIEINFFLHLSELFCIHLTHGVS